MSSSVLVAIITVSGSIIVAALSLALTKWSERKAYWQKRKIEHYKELISSLSDLAVDGQDRDEANRRFSHAVNTIALVAPQSVISTLMSFHDEVRYSNQDRSDKRQGDLLNRLLLAIRRDVGVSRGDDSNTFAFHLIGSAPPEASAKRRGDSSLRSE